MLTRLINLLFPPQCLNCDGRVSTHGTLCLTCWQNVQFISDPLCECCGLPFDYDIGSQALCAVCMNTRPLYGRARSVFRYDDYSHKLVTRFKYSDQTHLAHIYGLWLIKAGGELLANTDIIIPVPLHYWRFVRRRFNQSALLAHAIARKTSIKHIPNALKRIRRTTPQTGLTAKQREANVKGAFTVNKSYEAVIKNKNILLIDDVLTTGSTTSACTRTLLKAGAAQVNVLTLARTIR